MTGLRFVLLASFLLMGFGMRETCAMEDELLDSMISHLEREARRLGGGSFGESVTQKLELLEPGIVTSLKLEVTPGKTYAVVVAFEENCPPVKIAMLNGRGEPMARGEYRTVVSLMGTPDSAYPYVLQLALPDNAVGHCRAEILLVDQTNWSGQGFSTYQNYDLFGGDIVSLSNTDLAACVAACGSRSECKAYTFDKWNNWCFLKSEVSELFLNPRAESGVRTSVPAPAKSQASVVIEHYANRAFPYGGEEAFTVRSTGDCEQRCLEQDVCVAFTYFKEQKLCRLMSQALEYALNRDADSGLKWQRRTPTP